eukprot:CAMPEP_0174840960 /NCGR_PEP_ID=MMETSP1114-20130205/9009_1 /TAXON_ID=312471 /ORGANISM="Neobodo designis, Strain CCAP 1951/1" /LENGTH=399 /DNA_ID=CAMNT_0016075129 /DNA_START=54 /DNA_END=1250 /DNA_ORIENTATION=-
MGNAEVKAMVDGAGYVDDAGLKSLHRQYLAYGERFFPVDRSAFALLFRDVPFDVVDQVYDALYADAERRDAAVEYRSLLVPLAAASTLPPYEKARLIYDVFAAPLLAAAAKGEPASPMDVSTGIAPTLVHAVAPMRGEPDPSGRIAYPAYRCYACRQVPSNLVFICESCPAHGAVLGVPAGVILCKGCAGTWEGPCGRGGGRHQKSHPLRKLKMVPNPKVVSFPGSECAACHVTPISGPRLRCLECTDHSQLCSSCYAAGAAPGAHLSTHRMESESDAVTVADDVARLLSDLGLPLPEFPPHVKTVWLPKRLQELQGRTARGLVPVGDDEAKMTTSAVAAPPSAATLFGGVRPLQQEDLLTHEAFEQWVLRSERLLPLLGGHCSHFLPRCAQVEEYVRD